jgi:hypothetical protein
MPVWFKVADLALGDARVRFPEAVNEAVIRLRGSNSRDRNAPLDALTFFLGVQSNHLNTDGIHRARVASDAITREHLFDIPLDVAATHAEHFMRWGVVATIGRWRATLIPGDGLDDGIPIPDEVVSLARTNLRFDFLKTLAVRHLPGATWEAFQGLEGQLAGMGGGRIDLGPSSKRMMACETTRDLRALLRGTPNMLAALDRLMRKAGRDPKSDERDEPEAPRPRF